MLNYKRIIFFRTDMLGDTLLNLPVLDALKSADSNCHLTLACHPDLAEFLEGYPNIDEFLPYAAGRRKANPFELRELFHNVKKGSFDAAIVSNARKDLHVITYFSGIPKRIGYARKWGFFLTDRIEDKKFLGLKHEIVSNLELIRPLGIVVEKPEFKLPESVQEPEGARKLLLREGINLTAPLVLIHPFSSDPRKCWPLRKFVELIRKLKQMTHAQVVLIGSDFERKFAGTILSELNEKAGDLVGKTTLRTLCAIIKKALLLIGHDSGPMHMAAGVGTVALSLFAKFPGGPEPTRWRPWGDGHVVIHRDLKELSVDDVWQEVCLKLQNLNVVK